jgi:hypothetical protein
MKKNETDGMEMINILEILMGKSGKCVVDICSICGEVKEEKKGSAAPRGG